MLLNDKQIKEMQELHGVLTPFVDHKVKEGLSYGLGCHGYDIRIDKEFLIPKKPKKGVFLDPKNSQSFGWNKFETEERFILYPKTFVLAKSVEYIKMPQDVMAIALTKSTYARVGVFANITPLDACVPEDTEVLTKNGWKQIKDVKIGEEILTLDPNTFKAKYSSIRKIYKYEFDGELNEYNGKSIYHICTPTHKVFVGLRNSQKNTIEWKYIENSKIFKKYNYYFSNYVDYDSEPAPEYIDINGFKVKTDIWLRFYGCWLGDGSAYIQKRDNRPHDYVVKLAVVSKKAKREYFRKVLDDLGVKYYEDKYGFRFSNKSICTYLMQFGKAKDKYIDKQYFKFDKETLFNLFEGLINSDGCKLTNIYTTSSKQLADDVQLLSFLLGYKSVITKRETQETNLVKKKGVIYGVRFIKNRKWIKLNPKKQKKVKYKGMVYDLTVDSHVFLIRQKDRVLWTGNSWEGILTIEIANLGAHPVYIYPMEGIAQLLFFKIDKPEKGYDGKYQGQNGITLAK